MSFKFNPFTGTFDLVGSGGATSADNFSYKNILTTVVVPIPTSQQMVVVGQINIDGQLNIDGELALLGE